jgi:hypothetical protein
VQHVEPVQGGLGVDLVLASLDGEAAVGDGEVEAWIEVRLVGTPPLGMRALTGNPALTVIVRPDRVIAAVEPLLRPPRLPWTVRATSQPPAQAEPDPSGPGHPLGDAMFVTFSLLLAAACLFPAADRRGRRPDRPGRVARDVPAPPLPVRPDNPDGRAVSLLQSPNAGRSDFTAGSLAWPSSGRWSSCSVVFSSE